MHSLLTENAGEIIPRSKENASQTKDGGVISLNVGLAGQVLLMKILVLS